MAAYFLVVGALIGFSFRQRRLEALVLASTLSIVVPITSEMAGGRLSADQVVLSVYSVGPLIYLLCFLPSVFACLMVSRLLRRLDKREAG